MKVYAVQVRQQLKGKQWRDELIAIRCTVEEANEVANNYPGGWVCEFGTNGKPLKPAEP